MNKKNPLWIPILVLISLGFTVLLGFIHTQGADAGRKSREKAETFLKRFNYDKKIMNKIEECSISKVASKQASYLAALIMAHTIQAKSDSTKKTRLSINKLNQYHNNTEHNKQLNKNFQ